MTAKRELLDLQWAQLKHDETYHKDIVLLSIGQRVRHMALHYAKYIAYFFEAIDRHDEKLYRKTVTDAFIIALATANALNQNLGKDLGDQTDSELGLDDLGASLFNKLKGTDSHQYWMVREFAQHTGRFAKACESLDHLENVPFSDVMKQSNLGILRVLLAECSFKRLNLSEAYRVRIAEVESRSLFAEYHQGNIGGNT